MSTSTEIDRVIKGFYCIIQMKTLPKSTCPTEFLLAPGCRAMGYVKPSILTWVVSAWLPFLLSRG